MQEYEITGKETPAIKFVGEKLAHVSSERPGAQFWTELESYRTKAGNLIVVTTGVPADPRKKQRVQVEVFESEQEMTRAVGTGKLALRLYQEMGVEHILID